MVNFGQIIFLLLVLAIWLAIFLIIRQLVLWYWRVNHIIERQDKQNELLERIASLLEKQIDLQQGPKVEISSKYESEEKVTQEKSQKPKEPEKFFNSGDTVFYFRKQLLVRSRNSNGTYACTLPDGSFYGDIEAKDLKSE